MGKTPTPPRGGGGGQRPKKVCVPKIGLNLPAPLINFIFLPEEIFLMLACGSGRAGQGCKRPPPWGSLSNGLPTERGTDLI